MFLCKCTKVYFRLDEHIASTVETADRRRSHPLPNITTHTHTHTHTHHSYYGFHQWPSWLEPNTSIHLFSTPSHAPGPAPHPWQPLLSMLSEQKLKCAPMMTVHWRLRLLQPYYPYFFRLMYMYSLIGTSKSTENLEILFKYMYMYMYSGITELWTPRGHAKVSTIGRCPLYVYGGCTW